MNKTSRPHEQTIIELLSDEPSFAVEYFATALDEVDQPGGHEVLLTALRQIAESRGMSEVAEHAGIKRESLYRALSPKGNPMINTLLAVMRAAGLKLSVHRSQTA